MGAIVNDVPFVISSVGLSKRDQRALVLAIEFAQERNLRCRYAGADNILGHLVVVDIDTEEGRTALPRLKDDQLKLLFTTERIVGRNIVSLIKPIKFQVLKPLIAKMAEEFGGVGRHGVSQLG